MTAAEAVANILAHHGVKGQKWGVRRKATVGAQEVVVRDTRKRIKTSGGGGHAAHPEALRARRTAQISRASGVKALSNQELKDYANRLNLEQQVRRLEYNDKPAATRFVKGILGQSGKQAVQQVANENTARAGNAAVKVAVRVASRG